jgi:multidrug transporter EmrE-like cation transporter
MKLTEAQKAGIQLTAVELVGDISLKMFSQSGDVAPLVVGTSAYLGLEALMIEKLKTHKLAIINGYWDGMSNVATTLAAMALGETFTPLQVTGLIVISAGMFMLEWEGK